jgi:hypothetical protein
MPSNERNSMATSSILGGERAPAQPRGTDIDSLGPSDSSDSGSDVQTDRNRSAMPDEASEGAFPIAHGSDTDAAGTGERASADPAAPEENADILPDRVGKVPGDAWTDGASVEDPDAQAADELALPEDDIDDDEDDIA